MRKPPYLPADQVRSKNHRSKFSVSSLLLAGAISLTSLFTANDAIALSGTLSSAGMTTTPRESSGASGGATLIRTAATASAPAESTSTQTTGPSESSAPSTASTRTSGGTRRRAQTEEGGHRRTGGTATARTSRQGGKTVVDNKDRKAVAPMVAEAPRVNFSLSTGFESRYIFHGLDIIGFNSRLDPFTGQTRSSSSIIYENADVSYAGAHVGIGYIRALSPTYPLFQSASTAKNLTRHFYQEVDVTADYTASIVGGILDGTIGYNSYFFPYRDYKEASYQGEAFLRLAYKQLKYVVPSFTFYRYLSNQNNNNIGNLNGNYTEFRVDGAIPVFRNQMVEVDFAPYVAASYNISYLRYNNRDTGGWNDLETGIKLPTHFGKHFTITPYGNYGMNLADSDNLAINNFTSPTRAVTVRGVKTIEGQGFGERTHFWGGVTLSYNF